MLSINVFERGKQYIQYLWAFNVKYRLNQDDSHLIIQKNLIICV